MQSGERIQQGVADRERWGGCGVERRKSRSLRCVVFIMERRCCEMLMVMAACAKMMNMGVRSHPFTVEIIVFIYLFYRANLANGREPFFR